MNPKPLDCPVLMSFLTWAMSTSPNGSKYSRSSGSVVFHGSPSTIRSEHLFLSTFLDLAVELSWCSSDLRLSAAKTTLVRQF